MDPSRLPTDWLAATRSTPSSTTGRPTVTSHLASASQPPEVLAVRLVPKNEAGGAQVKPAQHRCRQPKKQWRLQSTAVEASAAAAVFTSARTMAPRQSKQTRLAAGDWILEERRKGSVQRAASLLQVFCLHGAPCGTMPFTAAASCRGQVEDWRSENVESREKARLPWSVRLWVNLSSHRLRRLPNQARFLAFNLACCRRRSACFCWCSLKTLGLAGARESSQPEFDFEPIRRWCVVAGRLISPTKVRIGGSSGTYQPPATCHSIPSMADWLCR